MVAEQLAFTVPMLARKYSLHEQTCRKYVDKLPGVRRVGLHRAVTADQLPAFEQLLRKRGLLPATVA